MHSLSFDRDGNLWITFLQLVAKVARFLILKAGEWRIYDGFTPGSLNHSFALDSEGFVKKDPGGRLYVSLWGRQSHGPPRSEHGRYKEYSVAGQSDR